jgi:hypothetical protein
MFVLNSYQAYNFSSWEGILKMDSQTVTWSDTESETVVRRYYIPVPVVTLGDVFSRIVGEVQGNRTSLCPKPLGTLLRYYEFQDHSAGGYFHDIPPRAVAWQFVTLSSLESSDREARVDSEGALHIIADKVISMQALETSNPPLFNDLRQDGYAALARNGSCTFIPLRAGDLVTNRSLQIISWEGSFCSPEQLSLALR